VKCELTLEPNNNILLITHWTLNKTYNSLSKEETLLSFTLLYIFDIINFISVVLKYVISPLH